MDTNANANRPPVKRPWLKFSLRTLMLVCVLICPPLAYLGNIGFHVRRQRAVVQRIESLSGYVKYEHEVDKMYDPLAAPPGPELVRRFFGKDAFSHVHTVHCCGLQLGFIYQESKWTNADLEILLRLPRLRHLEIKDLVVDDQGIKFVSQIPQLNYLSLGKPELSADGLAKLKSNRFLEGLELIDEAVTDETVRRIGELSHLKHLTFVGVNVTSTGIEKLEALVELRTILFHDLPQFDDRAMRSLAKLPKLESLTFFDCDFGDEGLAYLRGHPNLRELVIYGSQVTDDGLKHLQELPSLRILQLSTEKVTTACVPTLNQLTELEELYILNDTGARVTKDQLP